MTTVGWVPVVRHDVDGATVTGTATLELVDGKYAVSDLRNADGEELTSPPGSWFVVDVPLPAPLDGQTTNVW